MGSNGQATLCKEKQLNIDFLEKMMEIAKEQYGIDIKKNSDIPPSAGSEKTSNS